MTITRNFIDGSLLAKAKDGNRRAIREVLGHLEESLRPLAGQDEVIEWLLGAVRRIRDGEDPNAAFAWSPNGRPSECLELERWNWARWVETLGREDGVTPTSAIRLVGLAAQKSGVNGTIQDAWDRYRHSNTPDDIFPIPPEASERIRAFEARLATLRAQKKKP